MPTLSELRTQFHANLRNHDLLGIRQDDGANRTADVEGHSFPVWSNADGHNDVSVVLCALVARAIEAEQKSSAGQGSTSGSSFERCTATFMDESMKLFAHLNARTLICTPPATHVEPRWRVPKRGIGYYAQFEHLRTLQDLVQEYPELAAAIGGDYLVKPDILVFALPFTDEQLNANGAELDAGIARYSALRWRGTRPTPVLHASVSCKWTMRRDRAQNTRLEALNLVRNRKGRLPHVAAVTMECDPEILGSLCLGTGDIDCLYHGALPELQAAAESAARTFGGEWEKTVSSLRNLVDGSRLRDIADLPLDLLA